MLTAKVRVAFVAEASVQMCARPLGLQVSATWPQQKQRPGPSLRLVCLSTSSGSKKYDSLQSP